MKSIKRYKRKLAAAQEDIKKLLSGEYGIACEFCIHEADMSAPCTKGDKEWCRQHACWKGGSRIVDTEKQKPQKPIDRCMFYECPTCGNVHISYCKYCPDCGQKLDWNNEEVTDMENIEARR